MKFLEDDFQGLPHDEADMMKIMGFGNFDSTKVVLTLCILIHKTITPIQTRSWSLILYQIVCFLQGKKVNGNDIYVANIPKKRRYRYLSLSKFLF